MNRKIAVIPKDKAEQADRIVVYCQGCKTAVGNLACYKYLGGAELLALKASCAHGEFEDLKDDISRRSTVSRSALGRMMQFAEAVQDAYPTVGFLQTHRLLEDGKLNTQAQEKVTKFFHDETTGKTMTLFCRELGLIRQPIPPGTNNKPRSKGDTDKTAGDHSNEIELLRTFHLDANMFGDETDLTLGLSPSPLLFSLQNSLRVLQHKLDDILKARARDAKSKP